MGSYGANRCGSHAALHGNVIAQPSRDRNRARFHRVSFDDPGVKVHVIQGDHHEQTSSRLSINPCLLNKDRSQAQFEELMLPHLNAAYGLARWMMRHPEEAEDAVQDGYLRAWEHFDGYQGDGEKSWLL